MADPVLEVRDLVVEFLSEDGALRAVDEVSFSVGRGEIVGLVGESGAGKTLTSEAVLGLIRPPGRVSGAVRFRGQDLLRLDEGALARIRGKEIAMIFQNPGASLNPVIRVGNQLTEAMALHLGDGRRTLRRRAVDVLTRVGIPSAAARVRDYPHQFSGGMAQRVMIGMGISCVPSLLIADEPTTALDVTIQAQVLALIRQLAREMGMAVLLVSHDLGIVSQMCHRVIVMYAGRIVEEAPVSTVFRAPAHPYTQALIACLPGLDSSDRLGAIPGVMPGLKAVPTGCRFHPRCPTAEPRCSTEEPRLRRASPNHAAACHLVRETDDSVPLLEVDDLAKHFPVRGGMLARALGGEQRVVRAVDGISFSIEPGETLGLVGESGCGKTTTGRLVLRAIEPSRGRIVFDGEDVTALPAARLLPFRRKVQIVFQDPYTSLNPRMTVARIIGELIAVHRLAADHEVPDRVRALLEMVGLRPEHVERYPHELSGGQRQRVGIARALAVGPRLIVADEAVSALDVSVRAQILNLFVDLRERLGLAYLFVSHDLGVIRFVSHRVAVMYLGALVEVAPAATLFEGPLHPYTQALIAAIPTIGDGSTSIFDQPARLLQGELPSPIDLPRGCRFAGRCPHRFDRCTESEPRLLEAEPGHVVACHLYTGRGILMTSRDGFEVANQLMKHEVNRRAVLRALGWSAVGLAGAGPLARPSMAQTPKPKSGGTIKIGAFSNIDTLDAHNTTSIVACSIHNNIYNGLLKIVSSDGKSVDFKPELAREWEIQGDRVHIFRLHKGVTFHNGDPLTAADVKWNLERVKDKSQSPIHAWKLELLEAIETPDPHTVKLHFTKPFPFLRVAFTGSTGRAATILSPRAVKEKGKTYGRNPVGTGPFKFIEWKESDYILLEKNPNYWETDASGTKLPYLDKVHIKFIIEPSTLVAALKTGEVDLINRAAPQFIADLKKDPKLTALTAVGGNWRCLHLNIAKEPFNDKALRKAVTFAIDRKEILDKVEFGEGIVAHGPISPPMGAFYDPAFETGKNGQYYDLEQAKTWMKQAKYDGRELLYLSVNSDTAPRQAEVVQAHLAKIGIKVRIELADFPTFRRRWLQERQWDLVQVQWDADLDPDETLYPELHSTETWNAGKWVNKDFDRAVELAREENDFKKRKKYYEDSVRALVEDAPVAVLLHVNEQKIHHKHVKGFQMIPAGLIDMHRVWLDRA